MRGVAARGVALWLEFEPIQGGIVRQHRLLQAGAAATPYALVVEFEEQGGQPGGPRLGPVEPDQGPWSIAPKTFSSSDCPDAEKRI